MNAVAPYDLAPLGTLVLIGGLWSLLPLAWAWRRRSARRPVARLRVLTLLTLFLTFDLVLFGAFTRLTDSGLGCPDWPGCYGHSSPVGAQAQIGAAQQALPDGPVTHGKAWVEMIHRYLATGVGALIVLLVVLSWHEARQPAAPPVDGADASRRISAGWAGATLAWVCLQGAFGAWTVTFKLYPAIVTAHLMGGLVLLGLLAVQCELRRGEVQPLGLSPGLHRAAVGLAVLSAAQIVLGGWVSTNYAVLACDEFPTCQGQWWPAMDLAQGFTLLRGLGVNADGTVLSFQALTGIHYMHRLLAYAVLAVMFALGLALRRGGPPTWRGWGLALLALAAWQLASGLSNVLLGWPLLGAVAHTAGAAGLVLWLTTFLTRAHAAAATSSSTRGADWPSTSCRA